MTRNATYEDLAATVLSRAPKLGAVRLVAVDGRAGSGKTTFARRLAEALRLAGVDVTELHTDDFLDGWGELLAWRPRLQQGVLQPFTRGEDGSVRRYDWDAQRLRDEWEPVHRPDVLVVEGVGSASLDGLTLAVAVHAPRAVRLERGLRRDGEALRAEWERWMALEDSYFHDGALQPSVVRAGAEASDGGPASKTAPWEPDRPTIERVAAEGWGGEAMKPVEVHVDGAPVAEHDARMEYIVMRRG